MEFETAAVGGFVAKDRVLDFGVEAGLELLEEEFAAGAGQLIGTELCFKVFGLEDAFVDYSEHHRIDNGGAHLFHEIQGEGRFAIAFAVQEADVGVKADNLHGAEHMV